MQIWESEESKWTVKEACCLKMASLSAEGLGRSKNSNVELLDRGRLLKQGPLALRELHSKVNAITD